MTYIATCEDKRLDTVVYEHYGSLEPLSKVLEYNPHLINKMYLDINDEVYLPEFKVQVTPNDNLNLWD